MLAKTAIPSLFLELWDLVLLTPDSSGFPRSYELLAVRRRVIKPCTKAMSAKLRQKRETCEEYPTLRHATRGSAAERDTSAAE